MPVKEKDDNDFKVSLNSPVIFKGNMIRPGGALVLGQEQDSIGGRFEASQSFIGELTDVNIWDHAIKEHEIKRMSKSCLTGVGNLFQWPDFKSHIKGSVKCLLVRPRLLFKDVFIEQQCKIKITFHNCASLSVSKISLLSLHSALFFLQICTRQDKAIESTLSERFTVYKFKA